MFISGGENCFPEEIENGLLELPGIHHACVVAIPHPEFGQRPFAFVDAETWSPELWRVGLAELLPRFKIPDHFAPWPSDMPLKPNRARLSEWAVERLTEA
jgi:O-succinylbenzoic acid--CoA ligase